jgi:hypothetical protein
MGNIGEAVGGLVGAVITIKLADEVIKSIDHHERRERHHHHTKNNHGGIID